MNNPFFQRASEKQKETREQETANQPWIEKWRPTKLDDIVGHEETLNQMRGMIETGSMPNLLLSGPPGCGKTTSVHVLARTLLGDRYKDAVLELNASDERGIDVVRNKIKMFAQKKVTLPAGRDYHLGRSGRDDERRATSDAKDDGNIFGDDEIRVGV